jgi:hypothetical protein
LDLIPIRRFIGVAARASFRRDVPPTGGQKPERVQQPVLREAIKRAQIA